jgi:hypothetical protein
MEQDRLTGLFFLVSEENDGAGGAPDARAGVPTVISRRHTFGLCKQSAGQRHAIIRLELLGDVGGVVSELGAQIPLHRDRELVEGEGGGAILLRPSCLQEIAPGCLVYIDAGVGVRDGIVLLKVELAALKETRLRQGRRVFEIVNITSIPTLVGRARCKAVAVSYEMVWL